jgi:hypothetical protein
MITDDVCLILGLVVVGEYRGTDKKEAFPIEFENALEMNGGEGEI